tara:strand:- start:1638 stop:2189 length:552 start_codon:yes stop_codon:yes gene_type:complete
MERLELTLEQKDWLDTILLPVLKVSKIKKTAGRTNSGVGMTECFGYGSRRGRTDDYYKANTNKPEVFELLVLLGSEIVPKDIPFTCIQLNKNYQSKPHRDKNNIGKSMTLSLGEFSGGELNVDGINFQTKHSPIIFNAGEQLHYNLPIIGERYSVTYFVGTFSKSNTRTALDVNQELVSFCFK